jgi:hypothetical protein
MNAVATAAVKLTLALMLVGSMGLPGVAIGTLLPVVAAGVLVLFPAGCRQLQVTLTRAWRESIWPPLWPAAVMTAFALVTRRLINPTLVMVGAQMVATVFVYLATFAMFAMSPRERQVFLSRAKELIGRGTRPAAPLPVPSEGT